MLTEAHIRRYWKRVQKGSEDQCWEWTGSKDPNGYGFVYIDRQNKRATHLALFFQTGQFPAKHVLHKCDNPSCVNPSHLVEGTPRENMHDMIVKGRARHPKGEEHQFARLTEGDILQIRSLIAIGWSAKSIALDYGISKTHVVQIGNGRKWKHVGGPLGFAHKFVPESKKQRAIELYAGGMRQSEICRTVGLSTTTLWRLIKMKFA